MKMLSSYPVATQIGYSTEGRRIMETRQQLEEVMEVMRTNIEKISQRNDRLENLASRAEVLDMSACEFHKCAKEVKNKHDWKSKFAKYVLGGAAALCLLSGITIFFI